MEYPELAARTRRFSLGAPRAVRVSCDGSRVLFLRSGGPDDPAAALWSLDVATATERIIADPEILLDAGTSKSVLRRPLPGIAAFATDPDARIAVFELAGRLFRADLLHGDVVEVPVTGPATQARPDPTGQRLAYVTVAADPPGGAVGSGAIGKGATGRGAKGRGAKGRGAKGREATRPAGQLRVVDYDGNDSLLAGEEGGITWGMPEFVAEADFNRTAGYWWSPDGRTILAARVDDSRLARWHLYDPCDPGRRPVSVAYPQAGGPNAEVSLHLLDLDGGWVDVHWDRETYPYLVTVHWSDGGGPLITVLRRLQQHGLVLAVDPRTGETQVHAELADPRWVEPIPGTPRHLQDGRVLVGGELAHDGYDARCLFADGSLLTPPSLYVRRVVGRVSGSGAPPDLIVEASEGEPSQQHIFRVRTTIGGGGVEARRLTTEPGWHTAVVGGNVLAVGSRSLDRSGTRWTVWRDGTEVARLRSLADEPPYAPRPALDRVTDRRLPAAVLYPRQHVAGRRLPVLLDINGGPGRQEVVTRRSRWLARQWWADAGYAVVTVDNRGTPGVAPSFEKVIHRRFADVALADQADALAALWEKHPDLDLDRVAVRGWSFGGWLAALAALRRPDLFRCAIAGAPIADWTLYDTAFTERYLGLPEDATEVYAHHSLVELAADAAGGEARPLLLVQDTTDDGLAATHTLRLSAALLAAGRPHAVLPLAEGGTAESLLPLELDFLRRYLA